MATVTTREAYFETGLEVLADLGYGGLKLAEVCRRLRVTTGSFYHYFDNWAAYTQQLVRHWVVLTQHRVEQLRAEPDPRRRIDAILDIAMHLPHGTEAAIRVWSAMDADVRAAQEDVDRNRFEVIQESAAEILHDEHRADLFARWAVYLLVGYEQSTLTRDPAALDWIIRSTVATLDSEVFSPASPPPG